MFDPGNKNIYVLSNNVYKRMLYSIKQNTQVGGRLKAFHLVVTYFDG